MSTTTIYAHPDGHEITVGYGLLTACTSDGFALSMPIGPDGLAALGAALIERSVHKSMVKCPSALALLWGTTCWPNCWRCVAAQAEAFRTVHDKLYALSKLEHADSAAGGFAAAIVSVLEVGIANLPKFEGGSHEKSPRRKARGRRGRHPDFPSKNQHRHRRGAGPAAAWRNAHVTGFSFWFQHHAPERIHFHSRRERLGD